MKTCLRILLSTVVCLSVSTNIGRAEEGVAASTSQEKLLQQLRKIGAAVTTSQRGACVDLSKITCTAWVLNRACQVDGLTRVRIRKTEMSSRAIACLSQAKCLTQLDVDYVFLKEFGTHPALNDVDLSVDICGADLQSSADYDDELQTDCIEPSRVHRHHSLEMTLPALGSHKRVVRVCFIDALITVGTAKRLANMEKLHDVDFFGCGICHYAWPELESSSIQSITLGSRSTLETEFEYIAKIKSVTSICLYDIPFSPSDIRTIGRLQLRELLILAPTNRISEQHLAAISEISSLTSLSVNAYQGNNARVSGLEKLASLHDLEFLDINVNGIDDADIADLRNRLPNCQVHGPYKATATQ